MARHGRSFPMQRRVKTNSFVIFFASGASYSSTLTEVVTIVDTLVKSTGRSLTDAVIIVDTVIRSVSRTFVEAVTLVDSVIKLTSRTFSEVVTMVDTIIKATSRTLTDVVTVVDSFIRTVSRTLTEQIVVIDTREGSTDVSGFETPAAGNLVVPTGGTMFGLNPTYKGNANDYFRSGSQSFKISAATDIDCGVRFTVTGLKIGKPITVTVWMKTDPIITRATITLDTAQNGLGGAKSSTTTVAGGKEGYYQVVDFKPDVSGVNIFLGIGAFGADSSGTVWFDDLTLHETGVVFSLSRVLSESVTVVDSILKTVGRTLIDVVTTVDTVLRSLSKTISESVTMVDTMLRSVSRSLVESVTVVDTIVKGTSRTLTEVVTMVDTFFRTVTKTITETITVVDSIVRTASRTLSESVTVVDVLVTSLITTMRKGITILLSVPDRIVNLTKTKPKTVLETRRKDKTVLK